MKGGKAAERVTHHHRSLDPYRLEKRTDEGRGEGRRIIGGLVTTIVAGQVYGVDAVVTR
jgi:hypothetical protein